MARLYGTRRERSAAEKHPQFGLSVPHEREDLCREAQADAFKGDVTHPVSADDTAKTLERVKAGARAARRRRNSRRRSL